MCTLLFADLKKILFQLDLFRNETEWLFGVRNLQTPDPSVHKDQNAQNDPREDVSKEMSAREM